MPLPKPEGAQRDVLALPPEGHTIVLGSAGSGKTTLAILRAANLSDTHTDHGGRTLLLTFNRALVSYLKSYSEGALSNVSVEHYHRFARGYLNSRGQLPYGCILEWRQRPGLVRAAIAAVRTRRPGAAVLQQPWQFLDDEIRYLQRLGVGSADEYLGMTRTGRKSGLEAEDRTAAWEVLEEYLGLRRARGRLYDWDDLACKVVEELGQDDGPRMYRHVVVDEGQDFSPQMLRSIALAVPDDGSVSLFGDIAQQIYGRGHSWRSAGLSTAKVWEFRDNFRNSVQIARLALAMSSMPYFQGIEDLVPPRMPKPDGPLPTVVTFGDRAVESRFVLDQVIQAAKVQKVAILFREWSDARRFWRQPPRQSVRLDKSLPYWPTGPQLFYGTYHGGKGLEFDTVYLPFCDADRLPDPRWAADRPDEDADNQFGSLLYVAVTRARQGLVISHSSTLTRLFPADRELYNWVDR